MKRILRKVKDVFKRLVNRRLGKVHDKDKISKASQSNKQKATSVRPSVEVKVAESKFYVPPKAEEGRRFYPEPRQLPLGYSQDRIILQVRDPWWIHVYFIMISLRGFY